jgi:hypothetical protein
LNLRSPSKTYLLCHLKLAKEYYCKRWSKNPSVKRQQWLARVADRRKSHDKRIAGRARSAAFSSGETDMAPPRPVAKEWLAMFTAATPMRFLHRRLPRGGGAGAPNTSAAFPFGLAATCQRGLTGAPEVTHRRAAPREADGALPGRGSGAE